MMTPRILIVDDERQIHASVRLRLGRNYEIVCCYTAKEALSKIEAERFDLCLADIHMPEMDGLTFIERARTQDPDLGIVVLSAFDTDTNLRRAIPLGVYEFIPKPLPEREGFEARVPSWIDRTRSRRREAALARNADAIASDRDVARLERDVELVVAETARDALLQAAGLLTTIHALLTTATTTLAPRLRADPSVVPLLRNLQECRKASDAAVAVADNFFGSGYGNRDTSPALVNEGFPHAIGIATSMSRATEENKIVDFAPLDHQMPVDGLSGIDFLLMIIPTLAAAQTLGEANSTISARAEHYPKLDTVTKDFRFRHCLWINRRSAATNRSGIVLIISARGPALTRADIEAWLRGAYKPLAAIPPQGLVRGLQKCRGVLGVAAAPEAEQFALILALPT